MHLVMGGTILVSPHVKFHSVTLKYQFQVPEICRVPLIPFRVETEEVYLKGRFRDFTHLFTKLTGLGEYICTIACKQCRETDLLSSAVLM